MLISCWLFDFLSFFYWTTAALATANARIASLEAELSASRKAYDVAIAAKANSEKSQKSALAKAKKMKKHWPMRTKSTLSESKPWQSVFARCLLLLEVNIRLVLLLRLLLRSCTC
jgi:hypothetical protein